MRPSDPSSGTSRPDPGKRPLTREERLAAKLRENLHRRKAQARGLAGSGNGGGPTVQHTGADGENPRAGVPKTPPES